ncbi:MAG TPA: tetratricopeptide repeat protein, partial [Blastocatellia bacterium]|nr:tetratricopeptide repeat protein [Blastocatellia bacterium]
MIRQSTSRHEPKKRAHTALGLFCILFVLIAASPVAGAQEAVVLERGKTIEREIAGRQEHDYQLTLAQGECASLIVEQRGIDVIVRLKGSQGNTVVGVDDEYRDRGEERLDIVAEAAGSYRLSVEPSSLNAPAGWYAVRLAEVRPATENDRLLFEAHKLKLDSDRAVLAGEYENGRRFSERALAIGERVLGKEHPFIATLLISLGDYYEDKHEFAKAIPLFERALAICEKTLGAENPRTVDISRFLAYVYDQVNEVARAARLAERALEVSRRVLGPKHRLVARCLHTLSQVRNDPKEKEELLEQALRIAEEVFGAEHNLVGLILNDLGILHTNKGDYKRAEQYLLRAKAINESLGGLENTAHVATLFNLGRVARERKDYAKAEDLYRRAIAIVEKAFGPDNPRLAIILNNIANIYRARGDYARSLEAHLRVLRMSEATRGPYHPLTLLSLGNIAKTYAAQGNIAEAIRFQARVDAVIERNIEMNLAIGSERQKLSYLNTVAERTDRTISLSSELATGDEAASSLAALVLLQRKGRVQDAMSQGFASLRQRATPEEQALM